MRLAWKRVGNGWATRSAEGTEARIYPHSSGRTDTLGVEADLGSKTYARGGDYSSLIARSSSPARMRRRIIDDIKREAEGYILRFETTGIQDPKAANDAIVRMLPYEWHQRLADWYAKNPANDTGATVSVERFVYCGFQLDTNRVNGRGRLPNVNQLERWHVDQVIELIMSQVAADEASRGGPLQARKAMSYVQSQTLATTEHERVMLCKIAAAIFPKGVKTVRDERDVEIVFNAQKYGRALVTHDGGSKTQPGGILGAREKLAALGIRVMTDAEACAYVEGLIAARDDRARREARATRARLPWWVGRD